MNTEIEAIKVESASLQQRTIDLSLANFRKLLDETPQDQWLSIAIPAAYRHAKENRVFEIINYGKLRALFIKELEARSPRTVNDLSDQLGFKTKRITKTNELYTLHTDHGSLSLHGDDIFSRSMFRKRMFSAFGVFVPLVSQKEWDLILEVWLSVLQKNDDDITVTEVIKDALNQYLDDAEEKEEIDFIKKKVPIVHEGQFCFRVNDFVTFVQKEFNKSIEQANILNYLKEIGFQKDRNNKLRFWKMSVDDFNSYLKSEI